MKNIAGIILILTLTATALFAQKTDGKTADETLIRAAVKQMETGWNAKNGTEFAIPFAEDADYVVVNGMKIKGREAIDKGHQGIFDTIYKNTNLSMSVEQIRFLRPEVAVVHAFAKLKLFEKDSARQLDARITLVMTKNGDKWEIAAFQNTRVEPEEPQKN